MDETLLHKCLLPCAFLLSKYKYSGGHYTISNLLRAMPVGGFSPFPDNVHIKYGLILFDILPGLKAPGFLPIRSSDAG